jgi:glycosyltransferase involved in cell wall biosynthesis
MRRMKIGLNAISFVPGKIGGMETYFRNLLRYLQRLDTENQYTVFCDRRYAAEFPFESERFQVRHVNYARPSYKWFVRGLLRNTVKVDILGWEMRGLGVDFIHHPFTVLTPLGTGVPSVLTFWDMQHEFFPEFFDRLEIQRRRRSYHASALEAKRIIVSAGFTRDCLVERYGVAAEKIEVIHTGYGPQYRVLDDQEELERFRKKYGLTRPFLYYPAATWPHKNHRNLLSAMKILKERHRFDGELLLTGIAMQSHGDILAEIDRLGLKDRVRLLGYLTAEELPFLYNLARLLVFPSLFEGFGIPLVEAMACGCPVVCADATSLPEVAGDAGVLFDPRSAEEMAGKVWALWNDDARLREMRARGLERARLFTWDETARRTLQVYSRMGDTR